MEPMKNPSIVGTAYESDLVSKPREVGEVEMLVQHAEDAVSSLEKEIDLLSGRLSNVIRQEPVAEDKIEPAAAPRSTKLGGQLDSVVYRTGRLASNVRTLREMLGN